MLDGNTKVVATFRAASAASSKNQTARGLRCGRFLASFAVIGFGVALVGCGAPSEGVSKSVGTVNLTSLPAAEAWVDGKAAGSTPVALSLPEGRHEIVLKQAGFSEHRETLDVNAGSVGAVDATLDAIDPTNPDTVRQIASAFGVTVDPYQAPELHRGGETDRGVALLFPRNDVRKEGLATFRADVTPSYDGTGWLEFRKGKTVLSRTKFSPEKLVTTGEVPAEVTKAAKVGDTITWGIFYEDGRKPVTAQFEIVAKPAAAKKLSEIAADKRLARQPAILRLQLESEALQNYRLYSEALVKLLESRDTDKDNATPYGGIVSCLRRLDLEDTALYTESAGRALGQMSKLRGGSGLATTATGHASSPTSPSSSSPLNAKTGLPSRTSGATPSSSSSTTPGAAPDTAPEAAPSATPPTAPPMPPPVAAVPSKPERPAAPQQPGSTPVPPVAPEAPTAPLPPAPAETPSGPSADGPTPPMDGPAPAVEPDSAPPVPPTPATPPVMAKPTKPTKPMTPPTPPVGPTSPSPVPVSPVAPTTKAPVASPVDPTTPPVPVDPVAPVAPLAPPAPEAPPAPVEPMPPTTDGPTAPAEPAPIAPVNGPTAPEVPVVPTGDDAASARVAMEAAILKVQSTRRAALDAQAAVVAADREAAANPGNAAKLTAASQARQTASAALKAAADAQADLGRLKNGR